MVCFIWRIKAIMNSYRLWINFCYSLFYVIIRISWICSKFKSCETIKKIFALNPLKGDGIFFMPLNFYQNLCQNFSTKFYFDNFGRAIKLHILFSSKFFQRFQCEVNVTETPLLASKKFLMCIYIQDVILVES